MTIEITLIIIGLCLAACYIVLEYQKLAKPPYQEPVKPDMAEQWKAATKADTLDNIDNWNAKIGDKIWHKEATAELEPTPINPQAAWPFPTGRQP
jgi:hypothetical protein